MAMVSGVPFPAVYDWTWGEISEYMACRDEAQKDSLRTQAMMDFKAASLTVKMFGAEKGTQFKVTDVYSFLWTQEELQKMKRDEMRRKLEAHTAKPHP